jgi:hypothetical protein
MLHKALEAPPAKGPVVPEVRNMLLPAEGRALYEKGDYEASEGVLRDASASMASAGKLRSEWYKRSGARAAAAHAMALAALHRNAEATEVIRPVIERWRAELRSGTERVWVNHDLADALSIMAMASGGQERASALADARSALARVPDEVRRMKDVEATRERIDRLSAGRAAQ